MLPHPIPTAMTDALQLLDAEHRAFTDLFDTLSPAARLWRPGAEQWNAADVMEHVVRADRSVLFGLSRQLAAGDNRRDVGTPTPEAQETVRAFLRSDGRTRVPESVARHIAPQGDDPLAVRAEWDALPRLWREALAAVPPPLADTALILHPRAGPLTARSCAQFAADHTAHHARQLRRIREAEGFPA